MKRILLIVALAFGLNGCTENQRARTMGGDIKVQVAANEKLVNATWKDANLWVLTRKRMEGEVGETYTFTENSSFGIMEGKVIITER